MKKYVTIILGIIFASCSNEGIKVATNGLENQAIQITNKQSKLIFEYTKLFPNNTELSIGIIDNGKVKFIGIKRINDTIKITENFKSVFEIGSISKVFTATLLAHFVYEGKLKLDDPIQDYLDFTININDKITFRELANHTSGLPRLPTNLNLLTVDKDNPYKEYDSKKLKAYLTEKIEIQRKPGTVYEYSNLGVGLLGFGLTEISKTTYEDLLQEMIFTKYEMSNSTTNKSEITTKLVRGLSPTGEVTPNWDLGVLAGAGAILSTTKDLSKFALAQFDLKNAALIMTHKPTYKINENMRIGLGWHIIKGVDESDLIWHNGGTGGYTSSIALDSNNKNGILVLSNVSAFNKKMENIDQLCFGLIKTLH